MAMSSLLEVRGLSTFLQRGFLSVWTLEEKNYMEGERKLLFWFSAYSQNAMSAE